MTGKQPDQQICEIFFLCLDLIKKKDLSCAAILHSSVRKCSRNLWKISAKCTWTCLHTDQKAEVHCSSGGSCHFLLFSQLSTLCLFPFPPCRRRGKCWHALHLCFNPSILSPGIGVKKHIGTYPGLLQPFPKWSPLQNATRFTPYYALQCS